MAQVNPIAFTNNSRRFTVLGAAQLQGNLQDLEPRIFIELYGLCQRLRKPAQWPLELLKGMITIETIVLFFYTDEIPPEVGKQRNEIIKLLNLSENQNHITVKYGLLPQAEGEISLLTRSMLQMMISLSTLIEVPEDHVKRGLTPPR